MGSENQNVRIFICTGGSWERVYGVLRYKPLGLPRRILQLPLKLTFSGLMTCVARKLNLSLQNGFRLTYQFPINRNKNEVVDIADEEDVDIFMDMSLKMSHGLSTLYVVESVPGLREARNGPIIGKNVAGTSGKRRNVLDSEDEFGDASDLFGDQKGGNPLRNTGAFNGAGVDPVSTAAHNAPVSNLREKVVDDDVDEDISWLTLRAPRVSCKRERGGDGESEDTLMSLGPPSPPADVTRRGACGKTAGKDILWWMQPLPPAPPPDTIVGPSKSSYPEKGAGSRGGKDIFWDMPPPLPDPRPRNNLKTHKVYNSKEAMRLSLKLKSLEEGFKIQTSRSTRDKYEVRCVSCDWRISGTRIRDTDMFQVKDFEVQHKCSRLQGSPNCH